MAAKIARHIFPMLKRCKSKPISRIYLYSTTRLFSKRFRHRTYVLSGWGIFESANKDKKVEETENKTTKEENELKESKWDTKRMIIYGTVGAVGAVVAAPMVIGALGFGSAGVGAGTVAATTQSTIGSVSAGSFFAGAQSAGAIGLGAQTTAAIGAGGGFMGIVASKLWRGEREATEKEEKDVRKEEERDKGEAQSDGISPKL